MAELITTPRPERTREGNSFWAQKERVVQQELPREEQQPLLEQHNQRQTLLDCKVQVKTCKLLFHLFPKRCPIYSRTNSTEEFSLTSYKQYRLSIFLKKLMLIVMVNFM